MRYLTLTALLFLLPGCLVDEWPADDTADDDDTAGESCLFAFPEKFTDEPSPLAEVMRIENDCTFVATCGIVGDFIDAEVDIPLNGTWSHPSTFAPSGQIDVQCWNGPVLWEQWSWNVAGAAL